MYHKCKVNNVSDIYPHLIPYARGVNEKENGDIIGLLCSQKVSTEKISWKGLSCF